MSHEVSFPSVRIASLLTLPPESVRGLGVDEGPASDAFATAVTREIAWRVALGKARAV